MEHTASVSDESSVAGDDEGLAQTRQSLIKNWSRPMLNAAEGGNTALTAHIGGMLNTPFC